MDSDNRIDSKYHASLVERALMYGEDFCARDLPWWHYVLLFGVAAVVVAALCVALAVLALYQWAQAGDIWRQITS